MITVRINNNLAGARRGAAKLAGGAVDCVASPRRPGEVICQLPCTLEGRRRVRRAMASGTEGVIMFDDRCPADLKGVRRDRKPLGAPVKPMQAGRRKALLAKQIRFDGRTMTKAQMIEEVVRQGGVIKRDHFPKYVFSRSAFNRMDAAEQRAYDEKLKTKMPFAVQLPSGTFFEVTQTEADYFAEVAGQGARHGA